MCTVIGRKVITVFSLGAALSHTKQTLPNNNHIVEEDMISVESNYLSRSLCLVPSSHNLLLIYFSICIYPYPLEIIFLSNEGLPSWLRLCKESACSMGDLGSIPGFGKYTGTPVFLSGESPWTEESGGLKSMGLQRVRHD